ncbi:hypothetical protein Val02_38150 [Virgisporangium aliadipatigenens]|uniref:N-acetyltransferase domain-containing protein n=1 Tax=Virgisporangium aliadipatigenens TaxID=741659 RepID=A0A8J4DQT6_9ACTN|nr:GNAT family N-acetyltransferase [Virgisporangium aliadipatigenens]GIJ46929.1 hypothetical protein Val02_38150 [Virgisporangium aliadipatigenens]
MKIRAIAPGDAQRVAVLLTQLGYPTTAAEAAQRVAYFAQDGRSVLLGADDGGVLVGVASWTIYPTLEKPGGVARLSALVVDETRRNKGIGRALMNAGEEWARAGGAQKAEVTSSRHREAAHAFYQGLGYTDVCDRSARFIRELDAT